jgi:alkylation response protein AidB-like acyl-CoA dehydrogenase
MKSQCSKTIRASGLNSIFQKHSVAFNVNTCRFSTDAKRPFDPSRGLTDDAVQYYELARNFASAKLAPHANKWDQNHEFPIDALREAASLGFGAMYVSSDYGGSEISRHDGTVIVEALSTGCVSTTAYLTIHNMCAWMINAYGSDDLKRKWLPRAATMEIFLSYCLTEPNSGSDAASLSTSARVDGNDYVLNGQKMFISGGSVSDAYLIMARTGASGPKGISCFLVEKGTPGLSFGSQERKMGWNSQPTSAVFLDNVRVPKSNLIGKEGEGFSYAMKGLNGGRLSIASCSIGGAQIALETSIAYTKTRKQFSKPLSEFQNVQFTLASMASLVSTSRLIVRDAAKLLDANDPVAATHCAMAKRYATESCFTAADLALQLHGGYGYLKDYGIERIVRDLRVHRILEGTNEIMNTIVAKQLLSDG